MEVQMGATMLHQAAWPQKQCISDNASSQSSITECHQAAVQLQPPSWQRATSAHGTVPHGSHDHSSMDSDATEAQRQASIPGSPKKSSSDTGAQRMSSRLRKRQRDALNAGSSRAVKWQQAALANEQAAEAAEDARRKAVEAIRLVALAQQLARREALAQPAASLRPRRLAARRAAPIVEHSDDPTDDEDGDAVDDGDDAEFSDVEPLSRSASPRRSARGLQAAIGARLAVLRICGDNMHTFCKGEVVDVDRRGQQCCVHFDSGDEAWMSLQQQHFRWLGPRAASAGCSPAMKAVMVAASALNAVGDLVPVLPSEMPHPQAPTGSAAVGGRVAVLFAGDGRQYAGWVLAYSAKSGKHHILYEDGEDEWLDLQADALEWSPRAAGQALHVGLPPGTELPAAEAAVGWQLGVYWKEDGLFYRAQCVAFERGTGAHLLLYDDGERESLRLRSETVKWLHPPPPVGIKRANSTHGSGTALSAWLPTSPRAADGRRSSADDAGSCQGPPQLTWGVPSDMSQPLPPPLAHVVPAREASPLLVASPRAHGGSRLLQGGGRASPRPFTSVWPVNSQPQAHVWGHAPPPAFGSRLQQTSSSGGLAGGKGLLTAELRRAASADAQHPLLTAWQPQQQQLQQPAGCDAMPGTPGAASAVGSPPSGDSLLDGPPSPPLLEQFDTEFDGGICDILCDGAALHCGSDGSDLDAPLTSDGEAAMPAFHAMSAPLPSLLGFAASLPPPPRSISLPHIGGGEGAAAADSSGGMQYGAQHTHCGCCKAPAPWELPSSGAEDPAMELEPELAGLLQTFVA